MHQGDMERARREAGLGWMFKPVEEAKGRDAVPIGLLVEDHSLKEEKKLNPKEVNPYLKDDGSGYPDEVKMGTGELFTSSVVGDGGASWRMKAMKRAREQATREGRNFEEVVEERWGSFGHFADSVASRRAAPSRAHLHAIRNRKSAVSQDCEVDDKYLIAIDVKKGVGGDFPRRDSRKNPEMRVPKIQGSLTWGRHKNPVMDPGPESSLRKSSLNKFVDDGSYMTKFMHQECANSNKTAPAGTSSDLISEVEEGILVQTNENCDDGPGGLTPGDNQVAAMVLKLRMKGNHEEADKLEKKAQSMKVGRFSETPSSIRRDRGGRSDGEAAAAARRRENDPDWKLAERITTNRRYRVNEEADEDYDSAPAPSSRRRKSGPANPDKPRRLLTQQERCIFCLENPDRPRDLVVSVGNFTYMMLPLLRPLVPGHCCIVPALHEAGTRNVEDDVWGEIRNFKKCLIMMFSEQKKTPVFLETVIDIQQQRRHCLVECVPLPDEAAEQAPVYFKQAIEEAESEWSQHHAKRVIETGEKGLRGSIPKGFPYFHVEFGLGRGFVHVIEDEEVFRNGFGLNIIRGILGMPEEDMHRRRRAGDPDPAQRRQGLAGFLAQWNRFDWTHQLNS